MVGARMNIEKDFSTKNKYGLIDGYRKTYGPVKEILEKSHQK